MHKLINGLIYLAKKIIFAIAYIRISHQKLVNRINVKQRLSQERTISKIKLLFFANVYMTELTCVLGEPVVVD